MKKIVAICLAVVLCLSAVAAIAVSKKGATPVSKKGAIAVSKKGALADGEYQATALTTHYASSCLAGIDYDSLFDVTFQVKDGVIASVQLDIGPNAKKVPETADVSMEDWPFLKLAEIYACQNLVGTPATKNAILENWKIEELGAKGVDACSGATESSRAVRDAMVNTVTKVNGGYKGDEVLAKDVVPEIVMMEGKIIGEEEDAQGRKDKIAQANDGDYVLFGVVSANNNAIDETAVDYYYIVRVEVRVEGGKFTSVACSTPNGSEAASAAVAEANDLFVAALVGKDATSKVVTSNLPYNSQDPDAFKGSVEAKIACDMIGNVIRNGFTHIVGWSY